MTTEPASSRKIREHPKAILVVEDDVVLRLSLGEWFRLLGFTVYEAATADEATTLLRSPLQIHVVLTDIDMPGTMNGLDLVSFIASTAPVTPVIVVSGEEQQIDGRHTAFFKKPYDLQEV